MCFKCGSSNLAKCAEKYAEYAAHIIYMSDVNQRYTQKITSAPGEYCASATIAITVENTDLSTEG